jgi:hypothetical protein
MLSLADWLAGQAPAWLEGSINAMPPLTPAQRRALHAICDCRTPALGGRVYSCTNCKESNFAYHSCHHRACPRCGGERAAEWTAQQTERLLPVPYFLVTCTVPELMRPLFVARPALMYDLLFTQAAQALQTVAGLSRHLGAELGLLGVLHTTGRQLQYHPHVHFIVPGGGLSTDHRRWRASRKPDWLLPSKPVEALLRKGFSEQLRALAPDLHAQVPESTWYDGWWVHWQPAGTGENVVKYLARYVTRTAISEERILEADDQHVRFRYTDSQTQEPRQCTLSAVEFMRRYLQHVLPPGFHRVRYFGWLHPSAKNRRLLVETLLAAPIIVRPKIDEPKPWHLCCPHCGTFTLTCVGIIPRTPPACER